MYKNVNFVNTNIITNFKNRTNIEYEGQEPLDFGMFTKVYFLEVFKVNNVETCDFSLFESGSKIPLKKTSKATDLKESCTTKDFTLDFNSLEFLALYQALKHIYENVSSTDPSAILINTNSKLISTIESEFIVNSTSSKIPTDCLPIWKICLELRSRLKQLSQEVSIKLNDRIHKCAFDGSKTNKRSGTGAIIFSPSGDIDMYSYECKEIVPLIRYMFPNISVLLQENGTNVQAEWLGLFLVLRHLVLKGVVNATVDIKGDNEFVIQGMSGEKQVKSTNIVGIYEACKLLVLHLSQLQCKVTIRHTFRESNTYADALSNGNNPFDNIKFKPNV
jgi:ribonuclease HI